MVSAFLCSMAAVLSTAATPDAKDVVYLSDQQHRFLYKQQGWGQLGIDECAHTLHEKSIPLQIGTTSYKKGLGHHAPGNIIIQLGEEFATFESDIGLQNLPACGGNVVFKVLVDDVEKFDSGVMKTDTPSKHISIPVEGASELQLIVTDAGDGIGCDCADWADARLIRSHVQHTPSPENTLDVAPFAEVITCDPARVDGARSTRIQEYHAEDVFLETPLAQVNAIYRLNGDKAGECIGLKWLERRMLREVGIEFDGPLPSNAGLQIQCWVGESLWQGKWHDVKGEISKTEKGLRCKLDWSKVPEAAGATRKIRWILPSDQELKVRRLTAITPTPLTTDDFRITLEHPLAGKQGVVSIYNGLIVEKDGSDAGSTSYQHSWPLNQPLALKVQHTRPRPWKTDRTVLRFQLPDGPVAVAVEDVLKNGGVYVRGPGMFVSRGDMNRDLDGFLGALKDKKTVLQRVREMPDQTFAQAIEHVHNVKQDAQPMLLSLACDNQKFIVHRDGTIQFAKEPDKAAQFAFHPVKYPFRMTPKFGSGKDLKLTRELDRDWLPCPQIQVQDGDTVYLQRIYVAPDSEIIDGQKWLAQHPVCFIELSAIAVAGATASMELKFEADAEKHEPLEISGRDVLWKDQLLAHVLSSENVQLSSGGPGLLKLVWSDRRGSSVRIILLNSSVRHSSSFAGFYSYWQSLMQDAMQVELPDPLITNLIRASQVHCLLAARNEEEGKRIAPWIASISYGPLESESNSIIRGMDYWGHHEFARRSLDFFINKYNSEGFLTTGYTLMGTGWHLWSLGEHFRLTQDKDWLKANAEKVAGLCRWIENQRAKTEKEFPTGRAPEYGLAPPGVMADWNAFTYYFCLNGHYYKGLFEAAHALAAIDAPGAEKLLDDARSFREDILRSYHWAQARMPVYPLKDGTSVVGYPSQLTAPGPTNNFFPGEDGNRSWCYDVELGAHQLVPQGVLDPKSREVGDMMDHMEDVQFLSEGWFDYSAERNEKDWFNLGGFAKVQPYYCRNMEIYALRDEVKPFIRSYFNTIPSLLGLETLSFQEHFAGVAAWNKTHETGYFLYYSRVMLVQERGDELWLMPFVTSNWLKDGDTISVKNAPTFFGPVSYEVKSKVNQKRIEAMVIWPTRQKPKSIALRVRHPEGAAIRNVSVRPTAGGKATLRRDPNDPEVIYLDESEPTAHVLIEY